MSIDAITNLSGTTPAAGGTSSTGNAVTDALGRDEFLTLSVAQLKNQDPLNPLESQDFTAQMAQFSSLEQLFDVNASLANIHGAISAGQNDSALDYIGKEVTAAGNTLYKTGENLDQGSYFIDNGANVVVTIFDENGMEVRRMDAGYKDTGEHDLTWDGKDAAGSTVKDGIYTFSISAQDTAGADVYTETFARGMVTGVSNQYAVPYLVIGERLLEPENVLKTSLITD